MQEAAPKDVTLDDLLEVVESAALAIERLQAVNAVLMGQMRDCVSAAQTAAADARSRESQLEELARSGEALREDAEWCRWFRNKYGASTFFAHIEREYQNARMAASGDAGGERDAASGLAPESL